MTPELNSDKNHYFRQKFKMTWEINHQEPRKHLYAQVGKDMRNKILYLKISVRAACPKWIKLTNHNKNQELHQHNFWSHYFYLVFGCLHKSKMTRQLNFRTTDNWNWVIVRGDPENKSNLLPLEYKNQAFFERSQGGCDVGGWVIFCNTLYTVLFPLTYQCLIYAQT